MMKWTTRDIFNKFLENIDSKANSSTTLEQAIKGIFFYDDGEIISEDESYAMIEDLAKKENDGIFTLINIARKKLEYDAQHESEFDLKLEEYNLRGSYELSHLYAMWMALNRISWFCRFAKIRPNNMLNEETLNKVKGVLNDKLNSTNEFTKKRLDLKLGTYCIPNYHDFMD